MPEHEGYMTLDQIKQELSATDEEVRALIGLLKIQPTFFPEDKRRRFYSVSDVERMKRAISTGR